LGLKRLEREADHSPPSSAIMAWCSSQKKKNRDNFKLCTHISFLPSQWCHLLSAVKAVCSHTSDVTAQLMFLSKATGATVGKLASKRYMFRIPASVTAMPNEAFTRFPQSIGW